MDSMYSMDSTRIAWGTEKYTEYQTKVLVYTAMTISKVKSVYVPIIVRCCYLEPRDVVGCHGVAVGFGPRLRHRLD